VIEIPPVKAVTTEHRLLTLLCGCGCETKAQAPEGVSAPVQYGPRVIRLMGKFVLVTVHPKRGKDGMTAAGVLPSFRGIAVHDAWKPYDTFGNVAGHALCGLPLHRRPPRHQRPRRPHQRLPGPPLDPGNRINTPGTKAPAARARIAA
jgi:Transposase IS66 family